MTSKLFSIAILTILATGYAGVRADSTQEPRVVTIDWSACQGAMDGMKKQVTEFNSAHKGGPKLYLDCMYSGNPDTKKVPERHLELTALEILELNHLRSIADAGYEHQSSYEKYLLSVHHVRQPEIGDACYYFVGIKINDNFITVDPNPFEPDCEGPVTDLWTKAKKTE